MGFLLVPMKIMKMSNEQIVMIYYLYRTLHCSFPGLNHLKWRDCVCKVYRSEKSPNMADGRAFPFFFFVFSIQRLRPESSKCLNRWLWKCQIRCYAFELPRRKFVLMPIRILWQSAVHVCKSCFWYLIGGCGSAKKHRQSCSLHKVCRCRAKTAIFHVSKMEKPQQPSMTMMWLSSGTWWCWMVEIAAKHQTSKPQNVDFFTTETLVKQTAKQESFFSSRVWKTRNNWITAVHANHRTCCRRQ